MNAVVTDLWPYLVLILVGFLPTEVWRMLGLAVAGGEIPAPAPEF